jgi:hypothetical protein
MHCGANAILKMLILSTITDILPPPCTFTHAAGPPPPPEVWAAPYNSVAHTNSVLSAPRQNTPDTAVLVMILSCGLPCDGHYHDLTSILRAPECIALLGYTNCTPSRHIVVT